MIYFLSTGSHSYTHKTVAHDVPAFQVLTYPWALASRRLERATYIFSDHDRLSFWQLELAAHLYRQLASAGCRVLNDPARSLQRLGLLRRLRAEGLNSFTAWPAEDAPEIDRFPVFLRTQSAHRGVLSDLLGSREALAGALDDLLDRGFPLKDLMIVEYCAEPVRDDLFRKLSVYRIGEALVAAPCVHERHWSAKYGQLGVADQDLYDDDFRLVRDNPFADHARRVFDLARIDYGRIDFGLVNGRPEVYEINTNPYVAPTFEHPFAVRLEAAKLSYERQLRAIAALDTPRGGRPVAIVPHPETLAHGRRRRLAPGYQWML
jgi:hypothetical protein